MRHARLIAAVTLLIVLSPAIYAQQPGVKLATLQITVISKLTGDPVPSALVVLRSSPFTDTRGLRRYLATCTPDRTGRCAFNVVVGATYRYLAEADDFSVVRSAPLSIQGDLSRVVQLTPRVQ